MRKYLVLTCLFLGGCGPVGVISTVGGASLYLAYQHSKAGGLKHQTKDFMLESKINTAWKEAKLDEPFLRVYAIKGIPVIVGAATSREKLEEAKTLGLMKSDSIQCLADDSVKGGWNDELEVAIRFKLITNYKISARNYHIKAIKNKVWIVGIAQTEEEKQEVISQMEVMKGVGSFKHHIIVSPDYLEPGSVQVQPSND